MKTRSEAERPHYFGVNNELFGLYHSAAVPITKAVLLCPPLGQDMVRCHRLYRLLAQALAADGLAALRFDYYGSGDSAGNSVDVDWPNCIANTVAAADKLRALSGCGRVVAFGARLGGSIALSAAAGARFGGLVMWDPVLDGAAHVARLDELQTALQHDLKRFIRPRSAAAVANQWIGYRVGPGLRQQLVDLQLEPPAVRTLVLDSAPHASARERLIAAGVTMKALQHPTAWDELDRLELAILSHELIQTVGRHLREVD